MALLSDYKTKLRMAFDRQLTTEAPAVCFYTQDFDA